MDKDIDQALRKAASEYREKSEQFSNEKLAETILLAQKIAASQCAAERLNYFDFMILQMRLIKRQWWVLQGIALFVAWTGLACMGTSWYTQRGMSIVAALFVILAIPELWKNRETKSIEIEEASYYNLRHVYGAKILSFGLVDVVFLSIFAIITINTQEYPVTDFLKQFIFPVMISTILCLVTLSFSRKLTELFTAMLCMAVDAVWIAIAMNDTVYDMISPAIWIAMFLAGSVIITILIYNLMREGQRCSEVI